MLDVEVEPKRPNGGCQKILACTGCNVHTGARAVILVHTDVNQNGYQKAIHTSTHMYC